MIILSLIPAQAKPNSCQNCWHFLNTHSHVFTSPCQFTTKTEALEDQQMCQSFSSYCLLGCQPQFYNLLSWYDTRRCSGAVKSRASVRHYGTTAFESTDTNVENHQVCTIQYLRCLSTQNTKSHKKNDYMVMLLNTVAKFCHDMTLEDE